MLTEFKLVPGNITDISPLTPTYNTELFKYVPNVPVWFSKTQAGKAFGAPTKLAVRGIALPMIESDILNNPIFILF